MEKDTISLSTMIKKRVIIAPLDWGLGHATRCIPIIHELFNQNIDVWIAGDGAVLQLLKNEFPTANFLILKGYKIHYSRQKSLFSLKIASQLPKILLTWRQEKRWMKRMQKKYHFSATISDNRPGIRFPGILSVYITHQLHIRAGNRFGSRISNRLHRYFIRKFDECWVPDAEENGLAGGLSHPPITHRVQYIGPLSRLQRLPVTTWSHDLICVLSGPEPQRTAFEKLLITLAMQHHIRTLIVQGKPGEKEKPDSEEGTIQFKSHLPAVQLNEALLASKYIICRAGYTTIMDLARLQLPALLIPTPGQAEQEYLAAYLSGKGLYQTCAQKDLPQAFGAYLENPLKEIRLPEYDFTLYKTAVLHLVAQLDDCNFAS